MSKTTIDLLNDLAVRPGCITAGTNTGKINVLSKFLAVHQLFPEINFPFFLERFAGIAAKEEAKAFAPVVNSIKYKAGDDRAGKPWPAHAIVDVQSAYVDMLAVCDSTGDPVPCTYAEFLTNDAIYEMYKPYTAGAVTVELPDPVKTPEAFELSQPMLFDPADELADVTLTERVTFKDDTGRVHRGHKAVNVFDATAPEPATCFVADSGEAFVDDFLSKLAAGDVQPTADPPANTPRLNAATPLPLLAKGKVKIPAGEYAKYQQYKALQQPIGIVPVNQPVFTRQHVFKNTGHIAIVEVINSAGMWVNARLIDPSQPESPVVYEVPPRDNLLGIYSFPTPSGYFEITVYTS